MHVVMLSTCYGSEDGFCVRLFHKDQKYEIADSLAASFIRQKTAKLVEKLGENNVLH